MSNEGTMLRVNTLCSEMFMDQVEQAILVKLHLVEFEEVFGAKRALVKRSITSTLCTIFSVVWVIVSLTLF